MPKATNSTAIDRFCSLWLDHHGTDEAGRPLENFRERYAQLGSLLTYSQEAASIYFEMSRDEKAESVLRLHEIYDNLERAERMIARNAAPNAKDHTSTATLIILSVIVMAGLLIAGSFDRDAWSQNSTVTQSMARGHD